MDKDRYKEGKDAGVDCICLTLNAGMHLEETLDTFFREVPVRWLYVIDGKSKDDTVSILMRYPRVSITVYEGMTTGKAFELLVKKVKTPWLIWIDVGKIPASDWYDTMVQYMGSGSFLGSLRYNDDGELDPIIKDSFKRPLGGPWLIRTDALRHYHVDDDYAQRNIDIIIKKTVEEAGGNYKLVTTTQHTCYLPHPMKDKDELKKRHDQNAKGIVKYITPEYAKEHASYLLDDHWMLMMHRIPKKWINDTNPDWIPVLRGWERRRLLIAEIKHMLGRMKHVF